MRCKKCTIVIRNPKGDTRDLQICAKCRGKSGRGDKKEIKIPVIKISKNGNLRYRTSRYASDYHEDL